MWSLFGFITVAKSLSWEIFDFSQIQTCGILINDHDKWSHQQQDIHHSIIESAINSNKKYQQSVIIQTKPLLTEAHLPQIFKSMRYNCYVHFHINIEGRTLFSLISRENYISEHEIILRKEAIFFMVISQDPDSLYTVLHR